MKILITRFPLESVYGGAEVQTLTLMRGLRSHGHDVFFLGSCPILLAEAAKEGFAVEKLEIGPPPVSAWHALSFFWRQDPMKLALKDAWSKLNGAHHIDAVLMLSLSEKLLLTREVAESKSKILWIEHDRVGHWLTWNPFLRRLKILSSLVTTVVVSELSKRLYVDIGWPPESIITIPNGIDLKRFNGPKIMERPKPQLMHVGCVARLSADKGIDVLIEAMEGLSDCALTIVGDGREAHYLNNWIEHITLKEDVVPPRMHIIPRVEDLGSFYRSLDLFVLPSKMHDPFGLVAAEAMSQGVPVIVSDLCGIAQTIRSGVDGMIVHAGDVGTLKEAIESLRDETMRKAMGEEGRKTANKDFPSEKMVEKYEAVLGK